MKTKKILILVLTTLLFLNAQTVNDTLFSVGELDGVISYWYNLDFYKVTISSMELEVGDVRDWDNYLFFSRSYLSFDISQYNELDSIEIAMIELYQAHSIGNNSLDIFPIFFDRPLIPCIVDHVAYGDSLDLEDWTVGDPDDTSTISSNIGFISNSPDNGWKSLDITANINADIANGRSLSQYRIRFSVDHDDDGLMDVLYFMSTESNYWTGLGPRLIISTDQNISVIDDHHQSPETIKLTCYPNPFNTQIKINITLPDSRNSVVQIYNIRGDLIRALALKRYYSEGIFELTWDGLDDFGRSVSSGVYFVTLHSKQNSLSRKILFIK